MANNKYPADVQELVDNHAAQDLSVDMIVVKGHDRVTVAQHVQGTWVTTKEGSDMLTGIDNTLPSEERPSDSKAPPKNIDVKVTKAK